MYLTIHAVVASSLGYAGLTPQSLEPLVVSVAGPIPNLLLTQAVLLVLQWFIDLLTPQRSGWKLLSAFM